MNNDKYEKFGNLEKFTPDGQYAYLFHEVLRAKALTVIIDDSSSTAYRLLKDAKNALGKPSTYKLTLAEFCAYYKDQRPEWLAYRFWKYRAEE
ncbi:hypothetical protein U0033_31740 [Chitinophaga sancti]|uniref:Uncharacterized protein n=1 Tax=Chitinophaga sancti TaxID=1004 RepID=A0ABZ0XN63_9BACT|nr:hypothetical protein [Chitinophaga sancti]WQD62466.1 hypothetical protein U0033_31740 [Chitinophaga sancti]WQG91965.1 hypothetical protein SR876_10645 [Chitinophaga sancti]